MLLSEGTVEATCDHYWHGFPTVFVLFLSHSLTSCEPGAAEVGAEAKLWVMCCKHESSSRLVSVSFGALPVLVVIAALQEFDPVGFDQVDTAMLLRNTPGPDIRTQIFQRFGLADAIEGVAQDSLYQLQQPLGGATVRLNPVLQVL